MENLNKDNIKIKEVIKNKKLLYGEYINVANLTMIFINLLESRPAWSSFDSCTKLAFIKIVNKIARLVCGRLHEESLIDIQEYIQLILDNSNNIIKKENN